MAEGDGECVGGVGRLRGLAEVEEGLDHHGDLVFAAASLFRAGYRWLRGYDGLGFGDVKFVAAGTLWIGAEGIPGLLLIAVVSALVSLLILRAQGHDLHGKQAISFGPHLAIGLWWVWVLGPQPI